MGIAEERTVIIIVCPRGGLVGLGGEKIWVLEEGCCVDGWMGGWVAGHKRKEIEVYTYKQRSRHR